MVSGEEVMSQLTPPGPAVSGSPPVHSVAPRASRPGPRRRQRGRCHGKVVVPPPVSGAPWQQEGLPLKKTFTFYIFLSFFS